MIKNDSKEARVLLQYLQESYKCGEPIFLSDIHIKGMNRPNLYQQIKTLTDNGKICRYQQGIYYFPKVTRYGFTAVPSAETIATYKYVARRGRVQGFYSGFTFANMIGISTQVPRIMEIVTNNIRAVVREIPIGGLRFIVRSSKVVVSETNVNVLRLLDLLKHLDRYLGCRYDEAKERIKSYIFQTKICQQDIDQYISKFPDSTFRFYHQLGLDDVFASR